MLSKFSHVFITSTTASSEVVNHASTVNVFSSKNSQFQLPQNFISQIDRGTLLFFWNTIFLMKAMYQDGIFAVEKWQIDGGDNADLEGNFEKILKNQIEIF